MNTVLLEINDHIATLTINKPQVLNALSTDVLIDLSAAFDTLEKSDSIYAVIITGAGNKSFVAGADLAEMKDKDMKQAEYYSRSANDIFFRIENFQYPVIAAINGFALGGGCELALACDIRIAADHARFAQPETGFGIIPGFGGTQRLARLIGAGRAKEMIYTCRHVKADEALAIGLVNKVTQPEDLMTEAIAMAKIISEKAPIAIRKAKKAINKGMQLDIGQGIELEVEKFSDCFATADQKMAMTAFVKKEKPAPFMNR